MLLIYLLLMLVVTAVAFVAGRARGRAMAASGARIHSLPTYHGLFTASAAIIPMLAVLVLWGPVGPRIAEHFAFAALPADLQPIDSMAQSTMLRDIQLAAEGLGDLSPEIRAAGAVYATWHSALNIGFLVGGAALGLLGAWWALSRLSPLYRSRNSFEGVVRIFLIACSAVAILTTIGIVFSVMFESFRFFARYPITDFLFGLQWSPQTAIREDQVGSSGAFGAVPLFAGTTLIMLIAMLIAGPIGLFSAIYMAEYASPRVRAVAKPILEVLAGVPTVVFGFFAALTVAPLLRNVGASLGVDVASESALAAGLVMGVMIIPFVSSLSDDIINSVPQSLRDGSYAMGATRAETVKRVVLPAALPGIVSAFMLAISRAVGETMIVVMAAGLSGNLTFNPLEAVTTVTVQIKTLLVGDQEFDSTKTLSAFALGFVLFFFTLALNIIALRVVRKYRNNMTDATANGFAPRAIDVTSDAARARIRKRYRAETRFRAYGILAVLFALAFLVFLITDIIIKSIPAFTVSSLSLSVDVSAEAIDPGGTGDPAIIATGDFMAPIRTALLAKFPDAAADRRARSALTGLVSSAAPDVLRAAVVADPALIGTTTTISVRLSDDADLFVKGLVTEVDYETPSGSATPSGTTGTIDIRSSSDDLVEQLAELKGVIAEEARRLRVQASRFEDLLAGTNANIADTESALATARTEAPADVPNLEGVLAKLTSDAASLTSQVANLTAEATELEARAAAPEAPEQLDARLPSLIVEINGGMVKATMISRDQLTGDVLIPLTSANVAEPGAWRFITFATPEASRKLSDLELVWLTVLEEQDVVSTSFNWAFFTSGDSREAELAGILGALVGSMLTMAVTLAICLPIGVASAIYLEEFAPKNRWTDVIEVNINNLAAVPSIIFGLLGLAIFLNFFGLPRSAPLVGGLVLALLVLPTIIIASRAALKAVPPSIREAALGVGASHQQAVFHHVLPLAMPGILTGTIIGMAHALGETAPLLLIGMVAFIVDVPSSITDAATVLPVQIFLWSDLPEVAFQAKTSAAIIVLLAFLLIMNGLAIMLRKRFERRW